MKYNLNKWEKIGKIISPTSDIYWMATYTGACCAVQSLLKESVFDIYLTGRDIKNRSEIGVFQININDPLKIITASKNPIFKCGEIGAFDENGVSYPYFAKDKINNKLYFVYVGWMPTVIKPYLNGIGLCVRNDDDSFSRVSRAPILPRNDDDFLSLGSSALLIEGNLWRLYYTSFLRWGKNECEAKHYYVIKYAESIDCGRNWRRDNRIIINILYPDEFSICRPSILKINEIYHMWFCYRGEHYKIGYAYSNDGIEWMRDDSLAGIELSDDGFDSLSMSYPHIFQHYNHLYMLYCGNYYGKEGVGIARLKL